MDTLLAGAVGALLLALSAAYVHWQESVYRRRLLSAERRARSWRRLAQVLGETEPAGRSGHV